MMMTSAFEHRHFDTNTCAHTTLPNTRNLPNGTFRCANANAEPNYKLYVFMTVYILVDVNALRPPYLISRKILRTFTIALAIRKNQMRIEFVWFVFFSFPPSHSIQCDSSKRILRNSCIVANYKLAQRVTFESHSNYVQHKIDKRKLYSVELLTFLLRKNT